MNVPYNTILLTRGLVGRQELIFRARLYHDVRIPMCVDH